MVQIFLYITQVEKSRGICVNGYCVPTDYDKFHFPIYNCSSDAINIVLDFGYLEILEVNDKEFSLTLRTIIYVRWNEPRLIPTTNASMDHTSRALDTSILDHIWLVHLFIYNLKGKQNFKVLTPGKETLGTIIIFDVLIRVHIFKFDQYE